EELRYPALTDVRGYSSSEGDGQQAWGASAPRGEELTCVLRRVPAPQIVATPLFLSSVAQQVHLNPTYFSECFHQEIGVTFHEQLRSLRLQFARSLLTMTPLSITDIAMASGFSTLTHFERVFHQHCGMTPSNYRSAGTARRAGQGKIVPKK
ncbi:MAG: helix-turn-helix transcriptional regulator, partial [Ktedonobacterales bacterium]